MSDEIQRDQMTLEEAQAKLAEMKDRPKPPAMLGKITVKRDGDSWNYAVAHPLGRFDIGGDPQTLDAVFKYALPALGFEVEIQ